MNFTEINVTVDAYDGNSVLPLNAINAWRDLELRKQAAAAEEARKKEQARLARMEQSIKESGVLGRINRVLAKRGSIEILLAQTDDNAGWRGERLYLDSSCRASTTFEGVKDYEMYDWLKNQYRRAGYSVNEYVYSPSYWKDKLLTIRVH